MPVEKHYSCVQVHALNFELLQFSVSPNISVCKIEEALTSLDNIQPDNNCSVVKLYEQLGDGASDIGNFTHALEYYHKMVSLSIQLLHAINAYHH